MKNKVYDSFACALSDVPDGASVMMACMVGPPAIAQNLILGLRDRGVKNLTVYSWANFGWVGGIRIRPGLKSYVTPAVLAENHQVKKAVVGWVRSEGDTPNILEREAHSGRIEVENIPLGVFAQKLAAGGHGFGGFYSPTGLGTLYARDKEKRIIGGREYIFESAIRAQFGLVRAHKADKKGNLVYRGMGRGPNPLIAKACDVTIAEVDEIVEAGELRPDEIVTPGVFVDRIVRIPEGGWR